jgi:heme A synthase
VEDLAVDRRVLRELMRRQLRLGATTFAVLVGMLGLLPLAFTALPDPDVRPGGALVVWAVLGVAVYPALVVLGRWYVVRAERNERDTVDLERP